MSQILIALEDILYTSQAHTVVFRLGYTVDILSDAMVYADHAGRAQAVHGPDVEDVRLAVQAKVEHSMSGPMSKEVRVTCHSR